MKLRAVAYIRKSTSGTDTSGVVRQEGSFERQRAAIEDYAKRRDIEILRWYEEPVSGKSIRKRKVFLELVKEAKTVHRDFKIIIFGEYDRFMRDIKEAKRYEVELDDAGIELHFTNLRNDGSFQDELYKDICRSMAAEYSRELARKVTQGMVRKAQMGSWLGGVAPYGYRTTKDDQGKVNLVIHEPEAKVIRKIFELSLKGWGYKQIVMHLNDQGIPASETAKKRNNKHNSNPDGKWAVWTIQYMLKNPIYKGTLRWNRRARVDCFDWELKGQGTIEVKKLRTENDKFRKDRGNSFDRRAMKFYVDRTKSEEEWIVKDNSVPAIVFPDVFDRVQKNFKKYSSNNWQRKNNVKYLMSGSLKCLNCGNSVFGHRYSKVLKGTGEKEYYYYYRCYGDLKKATHRGISRPMVRQAGVDEYVLNGIANRIERYSDPKEIREIFKDRLSKYYSNIPNQSRNLEHELKKTELEISRLIDGYAQFGVRIPEAKIKALKDKKEQLEVGLEEMKGKGGLYDKIDVDRELNLMASEIKEARNILNSNDSNLRVRIREAFLPKAEVDWEKQYPRFYLYWRRVPSFAEKSAPSASTIQEQNGR